MANGSSAQNGRQAAASMPAGSPAPFGAEGGALTRYDALSGMSRMRRPGDRLSAGMLRRYMTRRWRHDAAAYPPDRIDWLLQPGRAVRRFTHRRQAGGR